MRFFPFLLLLFVVRPLKAMDRNAADALFKRQAYAVSADAYLDLLGGQPSAEDDAAERLGLAESLYRSGQDGRARQAYEDYLQRHVVGSGQGLALLGLARVCADSKNYDGAIQAAQAAQAALPLGEAYRAVLLRADALYDSGRYRDAEEAYAELGRLWPDGSKAYIPYAEAWCEFRLGKSPAPGTDKKDDPQALANAETLFGRAVSLDPVGPFAPGALYQQGECNYALDRWTLAAEEWRLFLARYRGDPLAPAASYSLAWCLFEQGKFSDAATAFHEFSVIHADQPLAPWALYLAGVSLARGRDLNLAESAYRICLRLYPASAVADRCQYGLAWLATMRKDYVAAADAWTFFLKQWPTSALAPSASFLLADAQYQQGRYAAAHDQYMDLLKLYPQHPLASDALYYAANASLALGDWQRSRSEFQAYLKLRPHSPFLADAHLRLADCDYSLGRLQDAEAAYKALRSQTPGSRQALEAQEGLAWVSFSRQDWLKAASRFKAAALKLPPQQAGQDWLRAGDALFNAARHSEAEATYLQAARAAYARPLRAQAHFGAAWAAYRLKDFDRAAAEWDEARALSPDPELQAEASYWIGWALFRQGRYTQAAAVFSSVAARFPASHLVPDALVQQGNALHNAGMDTQALPLFQRVADTWPKLPAAGDALHGLQISYTALGREDDAVAAARAFLKSHADSDVAPDVQYQIAEHYLDIKDWPHAEKELDILLSQYPSSKVDLVATYWRGDARFHDLKFNDAIQDWDALVKRSPQNPLAPRALFRVGLAWYRQQEYAQAENAFRSVLDAYGNTRDVAADARFNLALTYKRMGRDPDAVAAYQAVVRDYPDSVLADMARIRIGYIYEDAGNYPAALDAYRGLAARDTGKLGAEAQYLVGDCLVNLKRSGEALLAYDAVERNFPSQGVWAVTALARGAEILESQGRYKEALSRYEKIAKNSPDPAWASSARQRIALIRRRLGLPPKAAVSKLRRHVKARQRKPKAPANGVHP